MGMMPSCAVCDLVYKGTKPALRHYFHYVLKHYSVQVCKIYNLVFQFCFYFLQDTHACVCNNFSLGCSAESRSGSMTVSGAGGI